MVKAEVAIRDRVATKAGSYIYNELVNGKSIRQAVEDFKDYLKNAYPFLCYICCCEHDHDPKCPWKLKKESSNISWEQVDLFDKAHNLHAKTCDCPDNERRRHLAKKCNWYKDVFLMSLDSDLDSMKELWEERGYKREDMSCCCMPHLSHWETDKIKLILNNDNPAFGDFVIFPLDDPTRPEGTVDLGESKFSHRLTFNEVQLLGQNKLINEMLVKFSQGIKVIYMYGAKSSGKSTIGNFLLNYVESRKNTVVPKMKNLADQCPRSDVWPLFTEMKRSCDDSTKEYFFLLDNTDKILEERWDAFHKELLEFIHKRNFFFIVTYSKQNLTSKLNSSLLNNKEACLPVTPISNSMAAKFILFDSTRVQKLPLEKRNPDNFMTVLPEKFYPMQDVLALCNAIEESDRIKLEQLAEDVFSKSKKEKDGIDESRPTEIKEELKQCLK